jgi:hypothetical protein
LGEETNRTSSTADARCCLHASTCCDSMGAIWSGGRTLSGARTRRARSQRRLLADAVDVRRRRGLFEAVCVHELEGVVAKRRTGRYLPDERSWGRDEEPRVLALGGRARVGDQQTPRADVRLAIGKRVVGACRRRRITRRLLAENAKGAGPAPFARTREHIADVAVLGGVGAPPPNLCSASRSSG